MRNVHGLLALTGLLCATAALSWAESSGPYRGPQNNGIYSATGLLSSWPAEGPALLWKANLGEGFAGVTVADGTVYGSGGLSGVLQALTLDGETKYKLPFGPCSWTRFGGTRSTPLVQDGVAVVTTPSAEVVAFDLATGEKKWNVNAWKSFGKGQGNMGWGYPATPVLADGKVILNACSRFDETPPFVGVDLQTGKTAWETDALQGMNYSTGDGSASAFIHNGRPLAICPTWRSITCIDPTNGKRLWEIYDKAGCERTITPVYNEGYLLFSWYGKAVLVKLNEDGTKYTPLWARAHDSFSQAVILHGRVYLFGNEKAPIARGDDALSTKGLADGRGSASGLLCLDAETGDVLACQPINGAGHVISAEGMLYATAFDEQTVFLIRPTEKGMEVTGTLKIPVSDEERKSVKEIQYQAWVNPVIAEGRLFVRYGPLWVYDLRAERPIMGWLGDGAGHYPYVEPQVAWTDNDVKWRTAVAGPVAGQPVALVDRVITLAANGTLACYAKKTGALLWSREHAGQAKALAAPVVCDGHIYALLGDGKVVCYTLDGEKQWEAATDASSIAPTIAGGVLVVQGKTLTGLNAADGQRIWQTALRSSRTQGMPARLRVGDVAMVVTSDGQIVRVKNGKVLGTLPIAVKNGVTVEGDVIYLAGERVDATNAGNVSVMAAYRVAADGDDAVKVTELWRRPGTPQVAYRATPLLFEGQLYVLDARGQLAAFRAADGTPIYQEQLLTSGDYLLQAGKVLYAGSAQGDVVVFSPGEKFARLHASTQGAGVVPAFAGDRTYLVDRGQLLCIAAPGLNPDTATWEMNLTGFFTDNRPLNLQLKRKDGKWIAATATARTWNKGQHTVDASQLTYADGKLTGTIAVTLNPDAWVPADKQPIHCTITVNALLDEKKLTGTFTGGLADGTAVTGEIMRL